MIKTKFYKLYYDLLFLWLNASLEILYLSFFLIRCESHFTELIDFLNKRQLFSNLDSLLYYNWEAFT